MQFSGGQQQRVALARALATSPGLLLLDEPLSALDARVRLRLRDQIKDLQRRLGVTTIMVTHDQEEAMSMADRIVVMNQGVIDQVGTPSEIYRHPTTAFVADFVGSMTFIDAEVDGPDGVRVGGLNLHCKDAQKFMQRRAGAARLAAGRSARAQSRQRNAEQARCQGREPRFSRRVLPRAAAIRKPRPASPSSPISRPI